jgi:hypothetical protein
MSSMGLSASAHYCKGKVADISMGFITDEVSCGMEQNEKGCDTSSEPSFDPYNCCADKNQQLLVENDFSSPVHYDLELPIGIALVPLNFFSTEVAPNYRFDFLIPPCNPPPRVISYRILYCSYLI